MNFRRSPLLQNSDISRFGVLSVIQATRFTEIFPIFIIFGQQNIEFGASAYRVDHYTQSSS